MDNSLVQGTFQEQELQKLQVPDDALYPIEAIMKRSGNKLLVKWVGRSDKFSSWALKKNVENVKRPENWLWIGNLVLSLEDFTRN